MIGVNVVISTASSGQTALVAALAGNVIEVLGYAMSAAGAVTAQFQSASTALTGAMSLATGVAFVAPQVPSSPGACSPWFRTASGEALNINLGGAVQVSGHLLYRYRPA